MGNLKTKKAKETKLNEVEYWCFSDSATDNPELTKNRTVDEFLKEKYNGGSNFGFYNLFDTGCYKLQGWLYDFRPFLYKYFVKYGDYIQEIYAPSRDAIRNVMSNIKKIVLVK